MENGGEWLGTGAGTSGSQNTGNNVMGKLMSKGGGGDFESIHSHPGGAPLFHSVSDIFTAGQNGDYAVPEWVIKSNGNIQRDEALWGPKAFSSKEFKHHPRKLASTGSYKGGYLLSVFISNGWK